MSSQILRYLVLLLMAAVTTAPGARARGDVAFHRGKLHFEEGDWRRAGGAFAEAGRQGFDPVRVHFWMGRCYLRTGSPRRARLHMEKALTGGLETPEIHYGIARGARASAETTAALRHLDRAEELAPDHPDVALLRGEIHLDRLEYDPAYEILQDVVDEFPSEVMRLAEVFPPLRRKALVEQAERRIQELETLAAAAEEGTGEEGAPSPGEGDTGPSPYERFSRGITVIPQAIQSHAPPPPPKSDWSSFRRASPQRGSGPAVIRGKSGGGTTSSAGS